MKNIVKNLSLRTQSVLKRGTVAMLCTILIGAGTLTFHSCKKDEVNKISKKEQITQRHLIQKKIIEIDQIITSTDGVQYRITGWVDVRPVLGWPPFEIQRWDITIENLETGEKWRFRSDTSTPPGNSSPINILGGTLTDEYGNDIPFDEFPELVSLLALILDDIHEDSEYDKFTVICDGKEYLITVYLSIITDEGLIAWHMAIMDSETGEIWHFTAETSTPLLLEYGGDNITILSGILTNSNGDEIPADELPCLIEWLNDIAYELNN